jgi:dTDP-4-dehydrorhamnose 3,5-epimerase
MNISIHPTNIKDVVILHPDAFIDERGAFAEMYKFQQLKHLGLDIQVRQFNYSKSTKNILRGLHFQYDPPMGKLMRVVSGEAFLVAVDLRKNSPTLGKWFGKVMSPSVLEMLWAPASFARGFCVLSDVAEIEYLCSNEYNKNGESGIRWNDPAIGIVWPVRDPILSAKDVVAPLLEDWLQTPESNLF